MIRTIVSRLLPNTFFTYNVSARGELRHGRALRAVHNWAAQMCLKFGGVNLPDPGCGDVSGRTRTKAARRGIRRAVLWRATTAEDMSGRLRRHLEDRHT